MEGTFRVVLVSVRRLFEFESENNEDKLKKAEEQEG